MSVKLCQHCKWYVEGKPPRCWHESNVVEQKMSRLTYFQLAPRNRNPEGHCELFTPKGEEE